MIFETWHPNKSGQIAWLIFPGRQVTNNSGQIHKHFWVSASNFPGFSIQLVVVIHGMLAWGTVLDLKVGEFVSYTTLSKGLEYSYWPCLGGDWLETTMCSAGAMARPLTQNTTPKNRIQSFWTIWTVPKHSHSPSRPPNYYYVYSVMANER